MWDRELEPGVLLEAVYGVRPVVASDELAPAAVAGVRSNADPVTPDRVPGARPAVTTGRLRGVGTACSSIDCMRALRTGAWALDARGNEIEASDIGGDGGSVSSSRDPGMLSLTGDLRSIGVVIKGELAAEWLLPSKTEVSVEMGEKCLLLS
jgi:hypothetical protein